METCGNTQTCENIIRVIPANQIKYYLKGFKELKLGRFRGKDTMNFPKLGTKFVESLLVKALGWTVVKALQQSVWALQKDHDWSQNIIDGAILF